MPELNQSAKSWKILTYLESHASQPASSKQIALEAGIFKNPENLTSTRIETAVMDLCARGLIKASGNGYVHSLSFEITDKGREFLNEFNEAMVIKWRCLG